MFYILNFKDNSFFQAEYPEEVTNAVNWLLSQDKATEDHIEIINASDENCRMTVNEFITLWS